MAYARQDATDYISDTDTGFATDLVFTSADGETEVTIPGVAVKHSTGVGEYGQQVMSNTARISFSENVLTATDFPAWNADDKINLLDVTVSFIDSAGLTFNGVIREMLPSRTLGNVVCRLGEYTPAP